MSYLWAHNFHSSAPPLRTLNDWQEECNYVSDPYYYTNEEILQLCSISLCSIPTLYSRVAYDGPLLHHEQPEAVVDSLLGVDQINEYLTFSTCYTFYLNLQKEKLISSINYTMLDITSLNCIKGIESVLTNEMI